MEQMPAGQKSDMHKMFLDAQGAEGVIVRRVSSQSVYVRLLGLLGARGLETLSPDLRLKIEEISQSNGRLGLVAEKTLANRKKEGHPTVQIVVRPGEEP